MFNEHETFRLAKPIPKESIPVGTVGVVLMLFPEDKYEVEFVDDDGKNMGSTPTFTVGEEYMKRK